jgi:aspartate kinase
MNKPFQVMKFGGTSVGDASCIARVVEIIRAASPGSDVAIVVSAMRGVTNRLIETANLALARNERAVAEAFVQLGKQHHEVVTALVHSVEARSILLEKLRELLAEGHRLCHSATLSRELTPCMLDSISGLGERLCAPLVAATLSQAGVASEALDATEIVVTDSIHGGAEPRIDKTRARCKSRIAPLIEKGIVPVVTGFIGATEEGVLTTLGRGGSDYSATILAAALDADEVVIWSDVPGLLTADPKLVEEACTIPEISYREAAELAFFGAKVLHPKTLHPVVQCGIPVWIKNTFASGEPGTKITPKGPRSVRGVTAITAIREATLIRISGFTAQRDTIARAVTTTAVARAGVILILQSSSNNAIDLIVPSSLAMRTLEGLRRDFLPALGNMQVESSVLDADVSIVTLVGQNLRTVPGTMARAIAALCEEGIHIVASAQECSDCSRSLVVRQRDLERALAILHRELELGRWSSKKRPVTAPASRSVIWKYDSGQASAD